MEEMLAYYNQDLIKVGVKTRRAIHQEGLLHAVCHLWVTDLKHKRIFYQLRSLDKDSFPGYYDITSAGHIDLKETPTESMIREAQEEIGLTLTSHDLIFLGTILEHLGNDNEMAYVYTIDIENPIFQLGPEVTGMFYLDIQSFLSNQVPYLFTDSQHPQHTLSTSKICPHDTSLIKEYLQRYF